MWLQLLALYERASVFIQEKIEVCKAYARAWAGPAPQNFYLLTDGRVLPTTTYIDERIRSSAYLFDTQARRIYPAAASPPLGRWRPLHYIGIQIHDDVVGTVDISDWLGDLRANPVPRSIPIQQLLQLYVLDTNRYAPIHGVTIVIKDDGSEDTLTL